MLIQPLEARLSTKIVDRSSEKNLNSRFPTQGVSCITPPLVYPRWASAGVVKTKNPSRTPKGPRRRAGGAVLLPSCERRRYMLAQLERLLRAGVRREARPRKLQLTLGLVEFVTNALQVPRAGTLICRQAALESATGLSLDALGIERWQPSLQPDCNLLTRRAMGPGMPSCLVFRARGQQMVRADGAGTKKPIQKSLLLLGRQVWN